MAIKFEDYPEEYEVMREIDKEYKKRSDKAMLSGDSDSFFSSSLLEQRDYYLAKMDMFKEEYFEAGADSEKERICLKRWRSAQSRLLEVERELSRKGPFEPGKPLYDILRIAYGAEPLEGLK